MALGRLAVAAATSVLCFFTAGEAIAMGRLLAPAGSERAVSQMRLAVTLAPRQSTAWWSLELQGPKRPVVLVVPAAPGTGIDAVSSRWLEALEQATAPRIVLSAGAPACAAGEGSRVHDTGDPPPVATIELSELAVLSSLDEVAAFAKTHGVAFAPADRDALSEYRAAHQFVAFAYEVPEPGGATETVRMTWRGSESGPAFQLALSGAKIPVTLWTIAGGRASLPPARELGIGEVAPVWKVADGRSDYPERRHAWLDSRTETSWLIEATGDDVLYDWRLLPQSSGSIEPVVRSYFFDDVGGACTGKITRAKSAGGRVAPACAKGELGWVEPPDGRTPCVESAAAGEIEPEALRCGALDDFALALSEQQIERTWVTRHRGVLFPEQPQSVEISGPDSQRVSPIVSASSRDAGGCGSTGGASGMGGGFGAGGALGGAGGVSGSSGTSSGNGIPPDPYPPPGVHDEVGCAVSGGDADCGGDTSSGGGDDSCSGDSGESSSEDSEGCGCDSTEGQEESGGDDCGGDSSSDEGSDCGGDSSSDGGDDCSGDSSGDGGDDCSGDSSGDGGDDCSGDSGGGDCSGETAAANPAIDATQSATAAAATPSRPRRFRPRVSAVALALCAFALFLRRSGRREQDAALPR
jgi:hypothetical protein